MKVMVVTARGAQVLCAFLQEGLWLSEYWEVLVGNTAPSLSCRQGQKAKRGVCICFQACISPHHALCALEDDSAVSKECKGTHWLN